MLIKVQTYSQNIMYQAILLNSKKNSGGIKQPKSGDAVTQINTFNGYFTTAIAYAGFIVIALGIIFLILALADQNMQSKAKGSMTVVGGIVMVTFSSIVTKLKIGTDTTGKSVTKQSLTIIGTGMTLVGIILIAYSVIQYILAFAQASQDEHANASKGLAVGIAFSSGGAIMNGLKSLLTVKGGASSTKLVQYVVYEVIGNATTYAGVGILIYSVVSYILAFRDESAEGKFKASLYFGVGVALTLIKVIIKQVTGLAYYEA